MLTDAEIHKALGFNEFTSEPTKVMLTQIANAAIAAYQAKLLAGVEMPEEFTVYTEDEPNSVIYGFTEDQLQQYAAAAAAQARMRALDEVTELMREYDMIGSNFSMDVAELRWKP